MNEKHVEQMLKAMIEYFQCAVGDDGGEVRNEFSDLIAEVGIRPEKFADAEVCTFESAGAMTYNRGLVLSVGRDEFQISIVKSR
jgi:hypothetical protein